MEEAQKESNVVEEPTTPEAPQEEVKTAESSELESDESNNVEEEVVIEEEPDYAAELERVKGSLDRAEHTIVNLKKKKKEKSEVNLADYKDDIINEVTDRLQNSVSEVMKKQFTEFRVEDRETYISDKIKEMTSNPAKQELIKTHYMNTINKTGITKKSIDNDLGFAETLADRASSRKVEVENRELKNSLVAKSGISNASYGQNIKKNTEPEYNPTQKDYEMARQFFGGDMDRYLKNKVNN